MAETLGMKSIGVGARLTGQTLNLIGQNSETTSRHDGGLASQGGQGYTPSIMSPIKHGTGIGLGIGDNTLYSMPSPLGYNRSASINRHDPVRGVDEQIREQQELFEKKLN